MSILPGPSTDPAGYGQLWPPYRVTRSGSTTDDDGPITSSALPVIPGRIPAHAVYPPVTRSVEVMGYVKDCIKPDDSRDIGRSSIVGGRPYYVFGDTFCKSFHGQFLGLISNSAAIVDNTRAPLTSRYSEFNDPDTGLLKPFIPLTAREMEEERSDGVRVLLWSFGGIVTADQADEHGEPQSFLWFEKSIVRKEHGHSTIVPVGTGLAKVRVNPYTGGLQADRVREENMLFQSFEPRVGGFSSASEGGFFYLWGHHGRGIVLARVLQDMVYFRSSYEFWNGGQWAETPEEAVPVLSGYQHGQFFQSGLFGPSRPWVFVGCTKMGDSKVMVSAAQHLEGPWEEMTAVHVARGINVPAGYMYCMYPHPWAFPETSGELFVTWSEHWPGGVVGAKMQFETVPELNWIDIDAARVPEHALEWLAKNQGIRQTCESRDVRMTIERTGLLQSPSIRFEGQFVDPVQDTCFEVRKVLANLMNQYNMRLVTPSLPPILQQAQHVQQAQQQQNAQQGGGVNDRRRTCGRLSDILLCCFRG